MIENLFHEELGGKQELAGVSDNVIENRHGDDLLKKLPAAVADRHHWSG